jgi:hypothetical protein
LAILGLVLAAPLPLSATTTGTEHDTATTASPAAPATRLIRIGPQALVRQDEHGKLTMVEEFAPEPRNRDVLPAVLGVLFSGMARALFDAFPEDIGNRRPLLQLGASGSSASSE